MLTKSLVDSIEMTASELSDYNASLEEEGIPSNLNEAFIESKLCRFEKGIFLELGRDVRKVAADPCQKSRFVRHHTLHCSDCQYDHQYSPDAGPV